MRKVIIAIAAGVLASASVVAAPVLPSVASLPAGAMAPAAGTKLDGASRTGMKHARGSSDLAPDVGWRPLEWWRNRQPISAGINHEPLNGSRLTARPVLLSPMGQDQAQRNACGVAGEPPARPLSKAPTPR